MKGYKLTDKDGKTWGNTRWGEDVSHRAKKGKMEFCTDTSVHYYTDPLLAAFFNPIHANFKNPVLWEGKAKGRTKTDGMKSICKEFTTTKQMPLPAITTEQRVEIGIRCALKVCNIQEFADWAGKWLSGEDRSAVRANIAGSATTAAGSVAAPPRATWAATCAAARATHSAVAWAGWAADAGATDATSAAWQSASAAEIVGKDLNLLAIIKEVMEVK